ncbi:hypothetical protein AB0N28_31415 [Streptomyces sp. NPDC051130]|uniref:hypothetical protein n=1 Tax=Streptomyces sp. NPDC051130 TaxID=3157223 RepID=UPI00343D0448
MLRWRLGVLAVLLAATAACADTDADGSVSYGARSCSDWAGTMDDAQRWKAAEELLVNAKSTDGTQGDRAPSTDVIRQFSVDLGATCDQGRSDDLLAVVADKLYASNTAYYRL